MLRRLTFVSLALVGLLSAALAARPQPQAPAAAGTRFAVYLVRGDRVAPVRRTARRTTAVTRASLAQLLAGPTAAERKAGYRTCIPAGTRLRSVALSGDVATVDLGGRFQAGGGSDSMLLRVAQVVHTATQFPTVHRVAFRLDGRPVTSIGGEGVLVSPPVGRAAFEGQAPPILVERPLPGDHVGPTLLVEGTANVFEARLLVEVRAPGGTILARRGVSASAGSGTRGSFRAELRIPGAVRQLLVVAYARSARDGSPVAVVRVPVVR